MVVIYYFILCSGDEDQAQERINKLAKSLKDQELGSTLRHAGVGVISCIIQRDEGRAPMRHSFHWSEEKHYYEEEPLLRHLEPPLSIYLEVVCHLHSSHYFLFHKSNIILRTQRKIASETLLTFVLVQDKLKGYKNIKYTLSRDRQWHLYNVMDKRLQIQRMFLRTLVRQSTNEGFMIYSGLNVERSSGQLAISFTSRSILRPLMAAMEELELNLNNATVKFDHAHMYLCILREQQIYDLLPYTKYYPLYSHSPFVLSLVAPTCSHLSHFVSRSFDVDGELEEATVEAILEEMAREIHATAGVRMHKLGVCEWEVKLWMASSGQANGAWRVVVTNVTGHTCTVHVSLFIVYRFLKKALPPSNLLLLVGAP